MAKQGMKRPDRTPDHTKNGMPAVPALQGKAKTGKCKANPIIPGTTALSQKVFHTPPHAEKPISAAYPVIDTDLARDNLENDIPEPDLP